MTSFLRDPEDLRPSNRARALLTAGFTACAIMGCAGIGDSAPTTSVILVDNYPPAPAKPLVVYDAYWQAVSFRGIFLSPGDSSAPQTTVPASLNAAYVVLAPGWDTSSTSPPQSLVVLQSRTGFSVDLGDTLRIPVDDSGFIGNCAAGSRLTQDQADFITQIVFTKDFAGLHYDAATCATTQIGGAGAH
ncbi:MAG: hypothetical protein NVS3B20_16280 [Polyangiales bacterium]